MLAEACFVWNHALALQKRYYRLFGKYIPLYTMQAHQTKRIKRNLLGAQTVQEIIERLDKSYKRFFEHKATRPPKFKKSKEFSSFVFKQCGYALHDNVLTINKTKKNYKFSLDRDYEGKIKRIAIKRNRLGEYFVCMSIEKETEKYGKSHNGASVGIDFGLKTYMTLSDGTRIGNPQFMKDTLTDLRRRSRNLSKCKKDSNNRERKRKELDRLWNDITNKRNDFQWKLAHSLCRKYDYIFIEDLNLADMKLSRKANRKLKDQAHGDFVLKLEYIASKYGVVIHKIDRYYPSSKTCTCGYVNKELTLSNRQWVCPQCGAIHDRDLLAANNILRQGIAELESTSKTPSARRAHVRLHPRISRIHA